MATPWLEVTIGLGFAAVTMKVTLETVWALGRFIRWLTLGVGAVCCRGARRLGRACAAARREIMTGSPSPSAPSSPSAKPAASSLPGVPSATTTLTSASATVSPVVLASQALKPHELGSPPCREQSDHAEIPATPLTPLEPPPTHPALPHTERLAAPSAPPLYEPSIDMLDNQHAFWTKCTACGLRTGYRNRRTGELLLRREGHRHFRQMTPRQMECVLCKQDAAKVLSLRMLNRAE